MGDIKKVDYGSNAVVEMWVFLHIRSPKVSRKVGFMGILGSP